MSSNDILFSRGVANATIVASGTKLAMGVIANPLSAPLANVDFEVFGSRGLKIPSSNNTSFESIGGILRFNPDIKRLEFTTGSINAAWSNVVVGGDLSQFQWQLVSDSHYVANKKITVIPNFVGTPSAGNVSAAITLDIQSTEPHILMRNNTLSAGYASLFMLGGTGNTTAGAVSGFEFKTTTVNTSAYGSKLEINPIIQGNLSTTMKSVEITANGMTVQSGLLSITGTIGSPTLKVLGSAHTALQGLLVDKQETAGVLPAAVQNDANKVATFSYATTPVLDIIGSGKVQINDANGAVLALKAINLGVNPGYLAKMSQGGYTGTDLNGIFVEISNATGNLAIFNGYTGSAPISAARIDSSGTLFLRNHLSVGANANIGGNIIVGGALSVVGLTRLSDLSVGANANIAGVLSVTGLTQLSNLSVSANTWIGNSLSVLGSETVTANLSVGGTLNVTGNSTMTNMVVGKLSVTNSLSVSLLNASTINGQTFTGQGATFGNLNVTGSTSFGSITYTDLVLSGKLTAGDVSVAGTLSVAGFTQMSDVSVTSNTRIGGVLSVGGLTQLSNLSVASNTWIGGMLSVAGNARVVGWLSVVGNARVSANLSVGGNIQLNDPTSLRVNNNQLYVAGFQAHSNITAGNVSTVSYGTTLDVPYIVQTTPYRLQDVYFAVTAYTTTGFTFNVSNFNNLGVAIGTSPGFFWTAVRPS